MKLRLHADFIRVTNRHATPYHAPVYLAQKLGYFADEDIKVALLEPNDPSGTYALSVPLSPI